MSEQLSLFEHAGMDVNTGHPISTYTKLELIAFYKEIQTTHYMYRAHIITTGMTEVAASDFLSFILKKKP